MNVVVVGAGQAGLAVSHELTQAGIEHVVLERGRVGQTWRGRWDSFCLVTPNWSLQLPGGAYDGDDADGFMPRDDIVAYLERYAQSFAAPVEEGVAVTSLGRSKRGFVLETSSGAIESTTVVLSTGAYQRPHRPAGAETFPADVVQIDAEDYHNPAELPSGPVLVVGSGQTGCQIAEELHESGRDVSIACGRAAWAARRIADHDLFWWIREVGDLEETVGRLPSPDARLLANVLASGHGGGHDLHYRTLRRLGVTLLGHFIGAGGRRAHFASDLGETVAWGDQKHLVFMDKIRKILLERGLPPGEIPPLEPFDADAPEELDLRGFGAVIFTAGFRPDYESWVECPDAFDGYGFPLHENGASTVVPGLHFVGVHYLRKRKSALFIGVGEDAAIVAAEIKKGQTRRSDPLSLPTD
jgi:putative flavoprotein involved in K+ transport